MKQNTFFETVSIPVAVARNAIPAVITMLVTVIYNIADTFFVGQTGSELQVAAVSLTTPVFLLFMAMGSLFGIGGTSLISRSFGAKRPEYARRVSAFCFYGCLITGVVMMFIFWAGMPFILSFIGASNETYDYARDYLVYIAISAPFVMISQAFGSIVRAEGKAMWAMAGSLLGTVVNIVLDPIMIIGMGMGVRGAAIATVIGNLCAAVYYVLYFMRKKSLLSISFRDFQAGDGIARGVFSVGVPVTFNSILMSFSNILMNNFLVSYGDVQVAAMGIAMKANMMVILLQIGIAQGIQPLLGYSYGAHNYKRASKIFNFSLLCSIIFGSVLTVLYFFAAPQIIHSFIDNKTVIDYGIGILRAIMLSGPFIGILFMCTSALQALGRSRPSLVLSLSRQGLVFIPLLFVLNAIAGFSGIVYAQPAADLMSAILAVVLYRSALQKKEDISLPEAVPAAGQA